LISRTVKDVFPHFQTTAGMGRILRMCTSSLIYHRETVLAFDANHIAKTISIFRDGSKMEPVIDKIMVVKAWESTRHLTGVPSHVKLVDLQALRVEQSKLSDTIFTKVMGGLADYFDTRRIGSGEMTEARIKELIALACKANMDELVKRVENTVDSLKSAFEECSFGNGRPVRQDAEEETGVVHDATYMLRTNTFGEISRLPNDFQFPKAGIYDCWVQWNVGNSVRQIPPLRKPGPREFRFIDNIPKTVAEKRSQRGKHIDKRRPSRKIYSDMKFICNYIESMASAAGVDTSDVSPENVRKMYDAAVKELIIPGERNQRVDQLKWRMMVSRVRKKLKD
jgi:hypothetical protein